MAVVKSDRMAGADRAADASATEPQRTLGARLVLVTLGFCAVFIALTVAVLTWSAWNAGVERMNAELAQIEQIYGGTLSKAIWEVDREALQTHVESAAGIPAVGQVVVNVTLGNRAPEVFSQRDPRWQPSTMAPVRWVALSFEPFPGGRETVGELMLYGDERVLWQRLRGEVAAIVIAQLLQSLMLAGLIMLVFNRMVTVHVQRIAAHLAGVRPGETWGTLTLQRREGRPDELSQLVAGVNQLQGGLARYLDRQHRYEQELQGHRDRLAHLVAERTAELQQANARLLALARTDALTGLPNRRHFDDVREDELRRARRAGEPLALLVCDIDCFKEYNDHHGHAMGDQCLIAVAGALRGCLSRAGDLVARIGGEEFGVLLPATPADAAVALAQRMRIAVLDCAIAHGHSQAGPLVSLSIGVAVLNPADSQGFDQLFEQADQALYRAKAAGRNRVVAAGQAEPVADLAAQGQS